MTQGNRWNGKEYSIRIRILIAGRRTGSGGHAGRPLSTSYETQLKRFHIRMSACCPGSWRLGLLLKSSIMAGRCLGCRLPRWPVSAFLRRRIYSIIYVLKKQAGLADLVSCMQLKFLALCDGYVPLIAYRNVLF